MAHAEETADQCRRRIDAETARREGLPTPDEIETGAAELHRVEEQLRPTFVRVTSIQPAPLQDGGLLAFSVRIETTHDVDAAAVERALRLGFRVLNHRRETRLHRLLAATAERPAGRSDPTASQKDRLSYPLLPSPANRERGRG